MASISVVGNISKPTEKRFSLLLSVKSIYIRALFQIPILVSSPCLFWFFILSLNSHNCTYHLFPISLFSLFTRPPQPFFTRPPSPFSRKNGRLHQDVDGGRVTGGLEPRVDRLRGGEFLPDGGGGGKRGVPPVFAWICHGKDLILFRGPDLSLVH